MKIFSVLALILFAGLNVGCETLSNEGRDHKPRYNYFEHGAGACCPHHAQQFSPKSDS